VQAQDGGGMGDWDGCPVPQNLPEEVTIGAVFGLSGNIAAYGEPQKRGVELAVAEINAAGYLGEGTTLVAVFEDGGSDGEASIAAMDKLIAENELAAVIGPTLSAQAFAADPIASENGVLVLGVSNTAAGLTTMNEDEELDQFIFRDSLPEANVIPNTIAKATEILGLENVGVIYGNDDDFTLSGYDAFAAALEGAGIEVVREETFARGDVDFSAQLTNIINDDPDAIIASALIAEAVPIVLQARQLGYTGPIIGGNGFNSPNLFAQGGEAAEGVIVGAAWNIGSPSELSVAFTDTFTEAYGAAPDQFAAQAYTGAWLVATAIRCGDSADPAAVRDALAAVVDYPTPLGSFSFDETRNPVHEPVVQIVQEGMFKLLTEETAAQAYGE
jgi:branched-chain amino acid transport system substrate-binding protein